MSEQRAQLLTKQEALERQGQLMAEEAADLRYPGPTGSACLMVSPSENLQCSRGQVLTQHLQGRQVCLPVREAMRGVHTSSEEGNTMRALGGPS